MVTNRGRLINNVNGISGVGPGGSAVVNLPTNQRYHRICFYCAAVNYTAPVVTMGAAGGTLATFTATVVNGAITAIAIASAGSGQTPGTYNLTITDVTGAGATATAVVAGGGTVTATPIVTSGGTATPISPTALLTSVRLLVNGVNIRDITPQNILKIAFTNLPTVDAPALGELPIYFTQPWTEITAQAEANSWDLFGQATFQIQLGIASNVVSPSVSAIQEFDFFRNTNKSSSGAEVPFLQPVAQHQFSFPLVSGRNDITILPFNFPIQRLWLQGGTAGNISSIEITQDGNKIIEGTTAQLQSIYGQYGFNFGQIDWLTAANYPVWQASGNAYFASYEKPQYFDSAYISDPDNRFWKALKAENSFVLRITSAIAQTVTVVMETLPGSFA